MFPISLIRHDNPELFFCVIAPVGANVEKVCEGLGDALKTLEYDLEEIRVIEQLKQFDTYLKNEPEFEYEKLKIEWTRETDFEKKLDETMP